jgi:hypothetical protein
MMLALDFDKAIFSVPNQDNRGEPEQYQDKP